jgi:hypothetical protein
MVKPAHIAAHVRSPERGGYRGRRRAGVTALLAAVWLLLDYPWGLLAFVAIAALYGLR